MQDFRPGRATYADVLAAPPNMVAELFDGVLHTMPRPRPRHISAASRLGVILGGPFDIGNNGPGGWWILDEPELHLGDDVAVPDLAGWRRDRMPALPETAWFGLPPDWTCEVLSDSTRHIDQSIKRDLYARHGICHLWHVDPVARLLEVFELTNSKWLLLRTYASDEEIAAPPFAAAPFKLGLLWAE